MHAPSRSVLQFIAATLLLAAPGCIGTSVGNPPGVEAVQIKLGVAGVDEEDEATSQKLVNGVELTEAWVTLAEIDLLEAGNCQPPGQDKDKDIGDDDGFDVPNTLAANLLTGEVLPAAPKWERTADESYCALRASFPSAAELIEGAPAALAGHDSYVRGTRADGTPFEILIEIGEELKLRSTAKSEFQLGRGLVGLVMTFNMNSWVNGGLLEKAEVKDGVIRINAASNVELAEAVKERVVASARLRRDRNRDGKFDLSDDEL